jgi:hypothetical protein
MECGKCVLEWSVEIVCVLEWSVETVCVLEWSVEIMCVGKVWKDIENE